MICGIDINQRIEFVSVKDSGDVKTVFVLRPLSGLQMMEFSNGTKDDILNMLKRSVLEIKNFSPAGTIEEMVNSLDIHIISELINKVNSINQITGQDEKN